MPLPEMPAPVRPAMDPETAAMWQFRADVLDQWKRDTAVRHMHDQLGITEPDPDHPTFWALYCLGDAYEHRDGHEYTHGHADEHRNADPHAHGHADEHADAHSYAHTDAHRAREPGGRGQPGVARRPGGWAV